MQLEKIVAYHKALADPTRVKLLILLAQGELNGLELAERLAISTATVTHHATKLRQANIIRERREKNTIYFRLNEDYLETGAKALVEVIAQAKRQRTGDKEGMTEKEEQLKQSVLRNFFTAEGRLKHIPAQLKKKLIVLESMVAKLEPGRTYAEKEINEWIKGYHDDFATIRRELVMHQYMYRENDRYLVNPKEMWARWETLS